MLVDKIASVYGSEEAGPSEFAHALFRMLALTNITDAEEARGSAYELTSLLKARGYISDASKDNIHAGISSWGNEYNPKNFKPFFIKEAKEGEIPPPDNAPGDSQNAEPRTPAGMEGDDDDAIEAGEPRRLQDSDAKTEEE